MGFLCCIDLNVMLLDNIVLLFNYFLPISSLKSKTESQCYFTSQNYIPTFLNLSYLASGHTNLFNIRSYATSAITCVPWEELFLILLRKARCSMLINSHHTFICLAGAACEELGMLMLLQCPCPYPPVSGKAAYKGKSVKGKGQCLSEACYSLFYLSLN